MCADTEDISAIDKIVTIRCAPLSIKRTNFHVQTIIVQVKGLSECLTLFVMFATAI